MALPLLQKGDKACQKCGGRWRAPDCEAHNNLHWSEDEASLRLKKKGRSYIFYSRSVGRNPLGGGAELHHPTLFRTTLFHTVPHGNLHHNGNTHRNSLRKIFGSAVANKKLCCPSCNCGWAFFSAGRSLLRAGAHRAGRYPHFCGCRTLTYRMSGCAGRFGSRRASYRGCSW